ncbi:NAD(P)-dependent alcohol dehydrogenase [Aspergillus clavatus NRRL 1]|uniref:Alcohol dehydrogenase n=1 Tax=Aspergillus clavatus (strain ATCC 1007 / CBS 513.65 / DSM 816 / NCTC 3887 / NRRL 1 / QM 1276 / 107) TaxID=344612 RepID=A1CDU3_ASPCL|nr:alcohol dehydrogenase [Aspergillus clavatus NRRL 1]EAW12020.1 alcohol dehydrogenase [Aspergillus clavatus NRRL 1]
MTITTTTTAIVAQEPKTIGQPVWSLEEIAIDTPGNHEVLVDIIATGVCHTDLIFSAIPTGTLGTQYPRIVGHEGAGYVRSVGKNVTSVQIGDPVLLSFDSCRSCEQCVEGHPAYCHSFAVKNYVGQPGRVPLRSGPTVARHFFGQSSFARTTVVSEATVVNAKDLIRSEDELKLFAPLGCSFQTGVGAITNICNASSSDSVMVMGVGGVGMAAIMAAKIRGCKAIIAVDRVPKRLELAQELGATNVVNTSGENFDLASAVGSLVESGPSIVIDTTGSPSLIEEGFRITRRRGKFIFVGVPPLEWGLHVRASQHINTGVSLIGCIEGDSVPTKAIPQMIEWYRHGNFPIDKLVTFVAAEEYQRALAGLHDGTIIKPILVWGPQKQSSLGVQ